MHGRVGVACFVTMNTGRTISAYFGKDPDLLPPTLLTPDQKIEIADAEADAATDGSQACILAAGVLLSRGGAAAAEGLVAGLNAIRQVLQDCAMGVALTGSLGMLLKVDPPDPDFRAIGYPEAMPKAKARRCRMKRCAPLLKAARRYAKVRARQASLIEAAAVAANRYGNAVTAGDAAIQHAQRGAYTTFMALSADLDTKRAKRGRAVAKALRRLGVRRLNVKVPKRVKAPAAALDRLVRKRLATDRADALALVRGVKPAARRVDLVKRMRAPARTANGLAGLPALDLVLLLRAVAPAGPALDAPLAAVTTCDEGSAGALSAQLTGLGAEPRLLAQRAVDELARRAAQPGCAA